MRVCEKYSRPDQPVRWFDNWDDLSAVMSANLSLAAWSDEIGSVPRTEHITFTEKTQHKLGAKGRTMLHCPSFITVIPLSIQMGSLAPSAILCWNEAGARQRSSASSDKLDAVDWEKLSSTSRALVRRLKKSAPAKLNSYSIMTDAWAKLRAGEVTLWWGQSVGYPSDLISE